MNKIRTTITIDKTLLKLAKKHKIRISTFLNNSLQDYIARLQSNPNSFRKVEATGSNPVQSIYF